MVAQRYVEKKKKRKENTLITFTMVTNTLNKHNKLLSETQEKLFLFQLSKLQCW